MAVGAIHIQIGTHAGFERKVCVTRASVTRQRVHRFERVRKITGGLQQFKLVAGHVVHGVGAIKLARVGGQRKSALRLVAGEAFGARRNVPSLRAGLAGIGDGE